DEPTVGLDPRIRYELIDVINSLRSFAERTIVVTTHYLDEAERLCDRVAIVHEGRIVALDQPERLLASLGDVVVELRVAGNADDFVRSLQLSGVIGHDAFAVGSTVT